MSFGATLDFLIQHFADEMVWCVVDEYHAEFGPDVLCGPMTYQQAIDHKQATEARDHGRKSTILFDFNQVSG